MLKPRPDGHAPDPAAPRRVAGSVALTGVSQGVSMLAGAVLAILVAAVFGSTPETDGFFVAYALYALFVLLAQSVRTSLPARLVEADSILGAFDRYLAGMALVFAASGVVFLVLADPVATWLTGSADGPAHATAAESLRILWPALGGQLFAGLAAALLGIAGDFGRAALAYAAGGLTVIATFLALEGPHDVRALPVAVVAGTVVTLVPLVHGVFRMGWRGPRIGAGGLARGAVTAVATTVVSSASAVLPQALF